MSEITINGNINLNFYNKRDRRSNQAIRNDPENIVSKADVRARDGVCQCCGIDHLSKKLEVHHIMPISNYPELSSDGSNMITLCHTCHENYHSEYKVVDAVTFAEFMGRFMKR